MTTYTLGSNEMMFAPGVIAWAINGYAFESDRPALLIVVLATWKIPEEAAKALLSKQTPYLVRADRVEFSYPAEGESE